MKNFFSSFFATLSALIIFFVGGAFVAVLLLIALAAMGEKPVAVTPGSYLVVDLDAVIQDTPDQMEGLEELTEALGGQGGKLMQLRQLTRAIDAAATDADIAGIYLRGAPQAGGYGSGYAALLEVRQALERFKAARKPIQAFLTSADTRGYFVMSVASEIAMDPYGVVFLPGLAAQPTFFTGAFEKFGVGVQVTRVGKYKSAVEPYTLKAMSPENRRQTQQLLDDVWGSLVADIEQARGLKAGALQQAVDEHGILRADEAKKLKLVDRVAYYDEVLADLRKATGRTSARQPFKQIAVKAYARLVSDHGLVAKRRDEGKVELGGKDRVAIVYAEGTIIDGSGRDQGFVHGDRVARELRQLRQDEGVKAIVLRVNSPGGSATASETMLRELRLAQKVKPVVVSMGTVAASGGYWISLAADRVFAEPTTITGSIGVFGMFLNFQGLAQDKIGLSFDTVKTGRYADMLTVVRPKTAAELALLQGHVDWIYEEFLAKVTVARGLDRKVVEEIAQGRVWSGQEALKLKLVDEIGGLNQAVAYAANKAGLGEDFRVSEFPGRMQFAEALAAAFDPSRRDQSASLGGAAGVLAREFKSHWQLLGSFNDPQGVYARLPFELTLP